MEATMFLVNVAEYAVRFNLLVNELACSFLRTKYLVPQFAERLLDFWSLSFLVILHIHPLHSIQALITHKRGFEKINVE